MHEFGPKISKLDDKEIETYENVKPIKDIKESSNEGHSPKNEIEVHHPDET